MIQGVGIGLRSCHYQEILNTQPNIPWFEVLSDNYMHSQGQHLDYLDKIRQYYPVTLHGVGMSLGSTDPLNRDYLNSLKRLADWLEPAYISDHLAWISINGNYLNELMPLPYTEETLKHLVQRIQQVQEILGQRILIENPATYLTFKHSTLSEWEFICELLEQADCYLLLDVNNIYVSAINCQFNPLDYLNTLPANRVKQIHLAGYEEYPNYLLDTHGHRVHQPVWQLYKKALNYFGAVPTLIEWDTDIPELDILRAEARIAEELQQSMVWN